MSKEENVKPQSIEAMDLEFKQLEIEAKRAELQDIKERLAEREMKRENKRQRSLTNGQTMKQTKAAEEQAMKRCNHKKGGNGERGIILGQGDDPQYAVLKHQFANGDIWVRCLRCGKTWKPPVKSDYYFNKQGDRVAQADGTFSEAKFEKAILDYQTALEFQTRNVMSGSIQMRFSDGGEDFREKMKDVTLR